MPRYTQITDKEELKTLFDEALFNHTNEVTKNTPNSVLSGIGYGVATAGQKSLVEVANVESYLFPDTASGSQLDGIASNHGIGARFSTSGSSTYIRIEADSGTSYVSGTHTFTGTHGIVFNLDADITISSLGYGYAKISSSTAGLETNVDALTITSISPIPSGHSRCFNEYSATNGRDNESDDLFRKRIKEGVNVLARGTVSSLEQAFMKVNSNVLKIFNQGLDNTGNTQLAIATQNGVDLTSNELLALLSTAQDFVSLSDHRPYGDGTYGIVLSNIDYEPIDVNFRVELETGYDPDKYRLDVQKRLSKYLDFRTFDSSTDLVEWDDFLDIAKNVRGSRYVPDQYFFVNSGRVDIKIPRNKLPRLRSFAIYDGQGVLIQNIAGTLNPVFYPNQVDLNYQLTVLKTIS